MSWIAYKIVLRLQTPMHIGQSKLGNLQVTRPYVHGKALWGALTARITRANTPAHAQDYRDTGAKVNKQLAFSYFYPTTGEEVTLWPWEDPEHFAWRFLGSYASTALDYSQNSAAEGSLHETEFIAPTTRDGQPVSLVGNIFEREGCELAWKEALPRLQLGGERTYGWGRVSAHANAITKTTDLLFGPYTPVLDGPRPCLLVPEGSPLLAHAVAGDPLGTPARGRVVPLLGRETRSAEAHGQCLPRARICWEPGSVVTGGDVKVAIGNYGIWQATGSPAAG